MTKLPKSVFEKSWGYILLIFFGLTTYLVWDYIYKPIGLAINHELKITDWEYFFNLVITLICWSVYFRIVKYFSEMYTSKGEDRFFGSLHSFCLLLVVALLSCLIAAVVIFYSFEDSTHKMEFSIVSCFISIPYLTYKFTQHYIRSTKKKTVLSN